MVREIESCSIVCLKEVSRRVRIHAFAGVDSLDEWPAVKVSVYSMIDLKNNNEVDNQAWVERVGARPGVVAGLNVAGQ